MTKRYDLDYMTDSVLDGDEYIDQLIVVESLNEKDEEIARLKAENEWIALDGLLPDNDQYVFTCNSDDQFNAAIHHHGGNFECLESGMDISDQVEYWKPAKAPPGDKSCDAFNVKIQ